MLSSTVGSYLSTPGLFLLFVLTLVHSHVGDMHALFIDKEEFDLFYKLFLPLNPLLIAMVGNYLLSFTHLSRLSRLFRVKWSNCTRTAKCFCYRKQGQYFIKAAESSSGNFQFCAVNNVSIEIEWVHRSLNEYADSLSKVIDFDDWSVSTGFFA